MIKFPMMLNIQNLSASIGKKNILSDINISIDKGEVVAVMGPNGSGKSTLAQVIMGNPEYKIQKGKLVMNKKDITNLETNVRSLSGIFLAFQYPLEIPGVNFSDFLRLAYNTHQKEKDKLNVFHFRNYLRENLKLLGMSEEFLDRNLNEGFSGGEKKKAEILQMAVLKPRLVILDETDSGLDVDALKTVFEGIQKIKKKNKDMSILLISHYKRVFDYLKPDKVYILNKGTLVKEGNKQLIEEIENKGYKGIR